MSEAGVGAGGPDATARERIEVENPATVPSPAASRSSRLTTCACSRRGRALLSPENSFGDCIPALAAGNSAILKPSEITPLTSLLMAEMLDECGLPGYVYQVATGAGDIGAELIAHVDFVMFTGSAATGRKVAKRAPARSRPPDSSWAARTR